MKSAKDAINLLLKFKAVKKILENFNNLIRRQSSSYHFIITIFVSPGTATRQKTFPISKSEKVQRDFIRFLLARVEHQF